MRTRISELTHGTHNAYSNYGCRCEPCRKAEKQYRDRPGHAEYQKAWRQANKDRQATYRERYVAKDPRGFAERRKAHHIANREHNLELARQWAARNPDRVREIGRRKAAKRRAVLAGVKAHHITEREWSQLCNRYEQRCAYCNEAKPLTMDHVVPITRGGSHSLGNIVPACLSCNSSKGTSLLVEWRRREVAA